MQRPASPILASRQLYQEPDILAHFGNPDRNLSEGVKEVCTDLLEQIARYVDRGSHVLVLGCAGGQESFALLRAGYAVTGLDIVPKFIEAATSHAESKGFSDRARFQRVDGYKWPMIESCSVDVVCMWANFVSVAGTGRECRLSLFAESKRVLKPGGIILAQGHDRTHPNLTYPPPPWHPDVEEVTELKQMWDLEDDPNVLVITEHPCSGHRTPDNPTAVYKMDPREVWQELEESGLRVVDVEMQLKVDPVVRCPSALLVAVKDAPL